MSNELELEPLVAEPAAARSADDNALGGSRGDGPKIIDEVRVCTALLSYISYFFLRVVLPCNGVKLN